VLHALIEVSSVKEMISGVMRPGHDPVRSVITIETRYRSGVS